MFWCIKNPLINITSDINKIRQQQYKTADELISLPLTLGPRDSWFFKLIKLNKISKGDHHRQQLRTNKKNKGHCTR